MKAFNTSKDSKGNVNKLSEGSFEDMIKARKSDLPGYEEEIQKQLEDYDGGLIAVLRVQEDENGHADQIKVTVVGAAHISAQLRLIKGLDKLADRLREDLIESAKGNADAIMSIIAAMVADEATTETKIKDGKK